MMMKKGKGKSSGLLPNSLKIISSCLKTVSTNASSVVRSAGASIAASIYASADDQRDQVTWAGFDKLEHGPSVFKNVLLLGYLNGFQVIDVEDSSNFSELVSKRDGPVTFLQLLPIPVKSDGIEGFRSSLPLLLVVAGDEANRSSMVQNRGHLVLCRRDGTLESQTGNSVSYPSAVRFYSLRSNCYVEILRFQSAVLMVRCSPLVVAVGLETQIYCIDTLTLEKKFSVLTYPIPHFGAQGTGRVNIGYGPMALGPRWIAYAPNSPIVINTGRLSPKKLTPTISQPTSPSSGSFMARYAVESSKQLAAGIIDRGCKSFSRYCPELLSDGPSSPGWMVGMHATSLTENAGMVVVKDLVSGAMISQLRAHTSPISALCFDPSGTLLVTASVHGNNINIFRIMVSCPCSGSGKQSYDWSSSHVHLYKLCRGITPAVIQDICFSHTSQWVAIVSSRGTCHIFVLSPFGGNAHFQMLNSHWEGPSFCPVLSLPWWSTTSFVINQQSSPPPSPLTLSVVSRIKGCNSGLLTSVGNAAASAAGRVSGTSGVVVAAAFHNSIYRDLQDFHSRNISLEHLLVYTSSGNVIQHELLPTMGLELNEDSSKGLLGSYVHNTQDKELGVRVEPVQWWDVCRRADSPERVECIYGTIPHDPGEVDNKMKNILKINDTSGREKLMESDLLRPIERFHMYLSNAEVQISSGRLPMWQNLKVYFCKMSSLKMEGCADGEFEIEKVPSPEVEIKRKDLLPVFDYFGTINLDWNNRGLSAGRYQDTSSVETCQAGNKISEAIVICHSKPASFSSTESSDGGSSRRTENLFDFDQVSSEKSAITCHMMNDLCHDRMAIINSYPPVLKEKFMTTISLPSKDSENAGSHVHNSIAKGWMPGNNLNSFGRVMDEGSSSPTSNSNSASKIPVSIIDHSDPVMDMEADLPASTNMNEPVDFEQFFQEGYCNVSELDASPKPHETVTQDVDRSDCRCEMNKPEDDEEDELLGGMFDFSEEDKDLGTQ